MKKKWRQLLATICVLAMVCAMLPAADDMQVEAATSEAGRQVITSCDSTEGITLNNGVQYTEDVEYVKEGGAFYINTTSNILFEMKFANAIDISKYGTIHLSLYVKDMSLWNGAVRIEVSSANTPDDYCIKWVLTEGVTSDWNELNLSLTEYASTGANPIDLSKINYIRIRQGGGNASSNLQVAVDDIYAYNQPTEKQVTMKEYSSGTITGGVAPSEADYDSASYVFGGWFKNYDESEEKDKKFTNPLSEGEEVTATTDNPVYAKLVPKDVLSTKAQYVRDSKDKKTITDCDSTEGITLNGNANFEVNQEKYGDEDGVFSNNTGEQVLFTMQMETPIDISEYETIHLSLYVSDPTKWNGLVRVDISSDNNPDSSYIKWTIDQNTLDEGWNELNLSLAEFQLTAGNFNSTNLNYIRIWQGTGNATGSMLVAADDIYAEREPAKRIISDCDTASGANAPLSWSNATLNTDATYIKEGTGSLNNFTNDARQNYLKFSLNNPIDISEYQNGALHFWIYVDNHSNMDTNLTVFLSSNGDHTKENIAWYYINRSVLGTGWREVYLPLANINSATSGEGNVFDPTSVQCLCITGLGPNSGTPANVYLDDVSVVDGVYLLTGVGNQTDIASNNGTGVTFTATEGEYLCGTGAYKNESSTTKVRHAAQTKWLNGSNAANANTYNIKNYQDNGALHFSLYINNVDAWNGDMTVQLSSDASTPDSNHLQWTVAKEYLKNGWNEFYLNLSQATTTGSVDFTKINYFRVMMAGDSATNISTILDDVCIMANDAETVDMRFVSTVDTLQYREVKIKIEKAGSASFVCEPTRTVYSALYAVGSDSNVWEQSPTIFHDESQYFFTQTIANMPVRVFDSVFTATPYWTTLDGTEVEGTPRTYTINQAISITNN